MIEEILNCCCDEHINAFNEAREKARRADRPPLSTPEEWRAQDAIDAHLIELRSKPAEGFRGGRRVAEGKP